MYTSLLCVSFHFKTFSFLVPHGIFSDREVVCAVWCLLLRLAAAIAEAEATAAEQRFLTRVWIDGSRVDAGYDFRGGRASKTDRHGRTRERERETAKLNLCVRV